MRSKNLQSLSESVRYNYNTSCMWLLEKCRKWLDCFYCLLLGFAASFDHSIRERRQGPFRGYRRWSTVLLICHDCKNDLFFFLVLTDFYTMFTLMYYIVLQLPSVDWADVVVGLVDQVGVGWLWCNLTRSWLLPKPGHIGKLHCMVLTFYWTVTL